MIEAVCIYEIVVYFYKTSSTIFQKACPCLFIFVATQEKSERFTQVLKSIMELSRHLLREEEEVVWRMDQ
jgi:acyl-CoA hydrolase